MKAALIFVLSLLIIFLAGCSAVEVATGYVVTDYCSQPQAARFTARALVNAGAAPNSITIDCVVDGYGPVFFTGSQ